MTPARTAALLTAALATGTLFSQSPLHLPATQQAGVVDVNGFSILPWNQDNSRAQMFYGASEVGSSTFTATALSFRFDGPIPAVGAPGPFTIQRLRVAVGTTTVANPTAAFDANLSHPLTTIFDGPRSYLPDQGSNFPEPWGGVDAALTFAFPQPVPVAIPPGGRFVVQLIIEGNSLNGQAHAMLDAWDSTGGVVDGSSVVTGQGCAAAPGAAAATMATQGTLAPGAAHALTGTGLGSDAPVFAIVGFSDTQGPLGTLPFALPGTACSIRTSFDIYWLLFADAQGDVTAANPQAWLSVPADPALNGLQLFEQLLGVVPTANQPFGFVLSNSAEVTLGTFSAPIDPVYFVAHSSSATFPFADEVGPKAVALQIQTQ